MTHRRSNAFPNFDNVGNSLLVCFTVATLNGYTDTMVRVRGGLEQYDWPHELKQCSKSQLT